jgi:ABC-2 type transport system ATP-binding protein
MAAQASGAAAIEVHGLSRRFGAHLALAPLELELAAGSVIGLIGPNGSGKSTFMRLLVGLLRPSSGSARVAGVPLRGEGTQVRRRCCFAPGELGLYGELRGAEQLAFLLRGRERAAHARARELALAFELPLAARIASYSHGMKRQLLCCAALAPDVPVRILDEPTDGLDPHKRARLLELVRAERARGTCVLLSSHHFGELEEACDRVLFLQAGRLIADEGAQALRERAQRSLELCYAAGTDAAPIERVLRELGARVHAPSAATGELRIGCELPAGRELRAFLAELGARAEFGRPSALSVGRLSLADLYRRYYGVEGL